MFGLACLDDHAWACHPLLMRFVTADAHWLISSSLLLLMLLLANQRYIFDRSSIITQLPINNRIRMPSLQLLLLLNRTSLLFQSSLSFLPTTSSLHHILRTDLLPQRVFLLLTTRTISHYFNLDLRRLLLLLYHEIQLLLVL